MHADVLAETDPAKQAELRRKSMGADYFLSSVTAVTTDGIMTVVDASGSRVGGFNFAAGHVVVVIGSNKIVDNYEEVQERKIYCLIKITRP